MAERNHSLQRRRRGDMPTELHEEILVRLPANDLLNFKCVCKDWLRLISSPQFIHKHLHRSKVCCNATRFLIPLSSEFIDYNYYINGSDISKTIPYPPGFSGENMICLGSCDGLICLLEKLGSNKLAVFNPSTGKSDVRIIDGVENFGIFFCSWFGHHPSTGEYVLVLGRMLPSPIRVEIEVHKFSSKLESVLSCTSHRPVICLEEIGTLVHGNLHWAGTPLSGNNIDYQYVVLAYDFERNEILQFSGPVKSYFILGVVDGCLSALFQPGETFELWIMKEYGVEQSWMKYKNIEGYNKCRVFRYPLGFSWNGRSPFDVNRLMLTKCIISDEEAALLKDQRINSLAILCADSLVSPELIWGE